MENLVIKGHQGKLVPNTFFRHKGETLSLAVVYPGYTYRCEMPIIYYLTGVLVAHGFDVLWVQYAYDKEPDFDIDTSEGRRRFAGDAFSSYQAANKTRSYRRVMLMGKSIGTLAIADVLRLGASTNSTETVWLTPLLSNIEVRRSLETLSTHSIVIVGTSDSLFDESFIAEIGAKPNLEMVIVAEADHGLELMNNPLESVEILKGLVKVFDRFVAATEKIQ
jgi:hypothetical protein